MANSKELIIIQSITQLQAAGHVANDASGALFF
jgi:hypothetical protein